MKRFAAFFFLVQLFLAAYYLDLWKGPNAMSRALPVLAMLEDGTLRIDPYHEATIDKSVVDGHYYSDKAPLPSFLVMPAYGALRLVGLIDATNQEPGSRTIFLLGAFICGSLPFAWIALLLFRNLPAHPSRIALAVLPLFGSLLFAFSGTFYSHVLAAALVLTAYIHLSRTGNFLKAGIWLGLAILTEYPTGWLLGIWAVLLLVRHRHLRPMALFLAGAAPGLVLLGLYNYFTTGSPVDFLYNHVATESFVSERMGFSYPKGEALIGLALGSYRGLLFYWPVLIPLFVQVLLSARQGWPQRLGSFWLLPVLGYYLLIASHQIWWGGWSYGPRHLIVPATLLVFEGVIRATATARSPWTVRGLLIASGAGLVLALMAKVTVIYNLPSELHRPFLMRIIPNLAEGKLHGNNLLTQLFGTPPAAAAVIWLLLFIGLTLGLHRAYRQQQRLAATTPTS